MTLRFTRAAEQDIIRLYRASVRLFGSSQARAYEAGLRAALAFIERQPEAVRVRDELDPPVRIHRFKSHVIIFTADGPDILVVRVRHGREDWARDSSPDKRG